MHGQNQIHVADGIYILCLVILLWGLGVVCVETILSDQEKQDYDPEKLQLEQNKSMKSIVAVLTPPSGG